MGSMAKERGVVKLVHPGPHVEIIKEPITASEVMSKNPRHCITRPDVFKFPWIVVKPESLLTPGRVYFVVPYGTIRQLIKASGHCKEPLPLSWPSQNSSRTHHRSLTSNPPPPSKLASSPTMTCVGMTTKHLIRRRGLISCASAAVSPIDEERGWRGHKKRYSQLEPCLEVVKSSKCRNSTFREFKGQSLVETMTLYRTYRANEETSGSMDNFLSAEKLKVVEVDIGDSSQSIPSACYEQPTAVLKSCLRKPDSARKSLSLSVTFASPIVNLRMHKRANKSSKW